MRNIALYCHHTSLNHLHHNHELHHDQTFRWCGTLRCLGSSQFLSQWPSLLLSMLLPTPSSSDSWWSSLFWRQSAVDQNIQLWNGMIFSYECRLADAVADVILIPHQIVDTDIKGCDWSRSKHWRFYTKSGIYLSTSKWTLSQPICNCDFCSCIIAVDFILEEYIYPSILCSIPKYSCKYSSSSACSEI